MHVICLWNLNNARDENKQAQIVLKGYFGGVFEVGCIRYSSVVMDPSLSHSVVTKKVYLNTLGLCFLGSPCLQPCWISLAVGVSVVGQIALMATDIVVMLVLWTFMLTVSCIDSVLSFCHNASIDSDDSKRFEQSSTLCKSARLQNASTDVPRKEALQSENGSAANYCRWVFVTK